EREIVRYEEERKMEENRAQVAARMKQYEDELARKRMMAEHELQRQRNAEMAKGLLLFIDEADAFLGRRSDSMSEGLRGSLNALLFRTGDQSRDFMVVLATNRPGDLDDAVLDRMDEALEFGLPGVGERQRLLALYLEKYIVKAGTDEGGAGAGAAGGMGARLTSLLKGRKASADRITVDEGVNEALLAETAAATEGFSARELAKFLAAVQAAVYGASQTVLTPATWRAVLERKLYEHGERKAFRLGHHGTGEKEAAPAAEK
ncbi:ATPase family AAA domain-containing protein 3-A, partial [Tetrabaena socialis]